MYAVPLYVPVRVSPVVCRVRDRSHSLIPLSFVVYEGTLRLRKAPSIFATHLDAVPRLLKYHRLSTFLPFTHAVTLQDDNFSITFSADMFLITCNFYLLSVDR